MEGLSLYFFKNKKMLLKVSSAKLFLGRGIRRICGRVVEFVYRIPLPFHSLSFPPFPVPNDHKAAAV